MTRRYARGRCQVCGHDYAVTTLGMVFAHQTGEPPTEANGWAYCRGSGRPPREEPRIRWDCHACGRRVYDGTGYIVLPRSELARHELEKMAHPPEPTPIGPMYQGASLSAAGDSACWRVYHEACDPEPDSPDYWIAIDRCRTLLDVLDWTLHLGEKDWYPETDWPRIARLAMLQFTEA